MSITLDGTAVVTAPAFDGALAAAYTQEADPIFFHHQRGEATEQEWLDKIEEIRARISALETPA